MIQRTQTSYREMEKEIWSYRSALFSLLLLSVIMWELVVYKRMKYSKCSSVNHHDINVLINLPSYTITVPIYCVIFNRFFSILNMRASPILSFGYWSYNKALVIVGHDGTQAPYVHPFLLFESKTIYYLKMI